MPPRILGVLNPGVVGVRQLRPGQFRALVDTAARSAPSFLEDAPFETSLKGALNRGVNLLRGERSADELAAARYPAREGTSEGGRPLAPCPELRAGSEEEGVFHRWFDAQFDANPELRAAFLALPDRFTAVPDTLEAVFATARQGVREAWQAQHGAPPPPHQEVLWAFMVLAAHGMLHDPRGIPFPRYLWDGRDCDGGGDKAAHFFCQGTYAAALLYDRRFGSGQVADALESVVDRDNWNGVADAVLAADAGTPLQIGPLAGGALAGPPQPRADYHGDFRPPSDATPVEARALRYAELLGAVHEANDTRSGFAYEVEKLGRHPELEDPLARSEHTAHLLWGLADSGVREELRANAEGARAAMRLMRDPSALLNAPHDGTNGLTFAAYARGPKGDFPTFYGEESKLLGRLSSAKLGRERGPSGLLTGSDGLPTAEPHVAWARGAGKDAALAELERKVSQVVSKLGDTDRERLAHYYASFCTRMVNHRVGDTLDVDPAAPRFDDHLQFARWQPADIVAEHIINRLRAVAAQHV